MTGADWILLVGSVGLLILGVPYAITIGLVSIAALFAIGVDPVVTVQQMVAGLNVYALLALPCFIIAGDLMHTGGLSDRLVKLAMVVARRFRGGIGMVAVLSATMFGAISGSAPATTAAIGRQMIPEMEARGYSRSFAAALAAAKECVAATQAPDTAAMTAAQTKILECSTGEFGVQAGMYSSILAEAYQAANATVAVDDLRAAVERRNADGSINVLVAMRVKISNVEASDQQVGYRLRATMALDEGQYRIASLDQVTS